MLTCTATASPADRSAVLPYGRSPLPYERVPLAGCARGGPSCGRTHSCMSCNVLTTPKVFIMASNYRTAVLLPSVLLAASWAAGAGAEGQPSSRAPSHGRAYHSADQLRHQRPSGSRADLAVFSAAVDARRCAKIYHGPVHLPYECAPTPRTACMYAHGAQPRGAHARACVAVGLSGYPQSRVAEQCEP